MPNDFSSSRRRVVQSASLGLAASVVPPVFAQAQAGLAAKGAARPLSDPRKGFPQPPFAEQTQPWPGLASRMQPKPDHGETSYRGSGRLQGRRALITGGDSGIGRGSDRVRA